MNTNLVWKAVLLAAVALAPVVAQQKQPRPKSQKEAEAIMAIFNATTPDARIAAVEELLTKYADTEFKAIALQVAAQSEQQKNDYEKMVVYCERTLEADPKNYTAMLMLGQGLALHTREFDLDREEKLTKAEKLAKDAMAIVETAPKPRPDLDDAVWTAAKKDFTAQGHETLGAAAVARKKYDVAVAEYRTAVEVASSPDPATMTRLASVLNTAGKPDEALSVIDKILAVQDLHPAIRNAATNEKIRANQLKAVAAKSAAPKPAAAPATATPPAPTPAPVKQ